MQTHVGARMPEVLDTLFEDALVLRDGDALVDLFEHGAVLVTGNGASARGGAAIARMALATWPGRHPYVADPRRVMQARELAVVVGERAIHVARRDRDGTWRYVLSCATTG